MPPRARTKRPRTNDSAQTFAEDYLDVDHWPHGWHLEGRARPSGERLLGFFKAFLSHLLGHRLARSTLLLHRDHLYDLGQIISDRLNRDPQLRRRDMAMTLLVFLDEDGGPVLHPPTSSARQRSFDMTCRKLRQYLTDSKSQTG
jgi:hypothetical protein